MGNSFAASSAVAPRPLEIGAGLVVSGKEPFNVYSIQQSPQSIHKFPGVRDI
jgi:hypothetical protein